MYYNFNSIGCLNTVFSCRNSAYIAQWYGRQRATEAVRPGATGADNTEAAALTNNRLGVHNLHTSGMAGKGGHLVTVLTDAK